MEDAFSRRGRGIGVRGVGKRDVKERKEGTVKERIGREGGEERMKMC